MPTRSDCCFRRPTTCWTLRSAEFGKSKGKDERDGKLTAVSVWTLEGAQAHVRSELARAERALDGFGAEADFFRALADEAARRDH